MSEREVFMERFEKARKDGLLDVKFFVMNGESLSKEEFFAAANRIDDTALIDGRSTVWLLDAEPKAVSFLA